MQCKKNSKKQLTLKHMKKIFIFVAIAMALSSCGASKYAGEGKGSSNNEQVSKDLAYLAAGVEASRKNNSTFSETISRTIEDENGESSTMYVSTQTAKTKTTFYDNQIETETHRKGGTYNSTTTFNGKAKNRQDEE